MVALNSLLILNIQNLETVMEQIFVSVIGISLLHYYFNLVKKINELNTLLGQFPLLQTITIILKILDLYQTL